MPLNLSIFNYHFEFLLESMPSNFYRASLSDSEALPSQWRFYIGARGAKPPQIMKKEGFSPPKFKGWYIIFLL